MKKIRIILSGTLVVLAILILVRFPQFLILNVFNTDVPLGSLISWFGLISYSLFWFDLLPGNQSASAPKKIVATKRIILILALLWGIISALLSGNWAYSFQNKPTQFLIWIGLSIIILFAPVLTLIILGISKLSQRISRNKH